VKAPPAEPDVVYAVELLGDQHDRGSFGCGIDVLDRYLKQQARQDAKRKVAVTYVLVPADAPGTIAGFYTLSATSIRLHSLPPDTAGKLPRYPDVPATLIGRLAASREHQGQGLGRRLLLDALRRSLGASAAIGSAAVIVDAKDASAHAFYEHYGFIRFPDQPMRLFLPMKTIQSLFADIV
jgi:GNAT superfamily N-acetyltransferase